MRCRLFTLSAMIWMAVGGVDAKVSERAAIDSVATEIPDRVILTWNGDPATSAAVTWRTSTDTEEGSAEIALADASPNFRLHAKTVKATQTHFDVDGYSFTSHSVTFRALKPNTMYAYRVGHEENWSEWFHFRTAKEGQAPFRFVYFGDAQNNLLSMWSRTIRAAYADAPKADFFLHAGDLVNRPDRDSEWSEWFKAGGWVHATIPVVATPGNHEYKKMGVGPRRLSNKWRHTFTFPENGPKHLSETVYYVDFQGARIISLNTNEDREGQVHWLQAVLADNPNRWTFVTFHHPMYSTSKGRDNKSLRELWQPLLEQGNVDLVLQGHDHTYGRGTNEATGVNAREDGVGPVYVVSVSGPKMYKLTDNTWFDRGAENTQLYQIIDVNSGKLEYKAYTATGELYDAFDLIKRPGQPNLLVDKTPKTEARRHENTLGKE